MPQLRIQDYFQSVTMRVTYSILSDSFAKPKECVFLPGEGIVCKGKYHTKALTDNAFLIAELEKIHCLLKNAKYNSDVWFGIDCISAERLDLYSAFLCLCSIVWDEDIEQTEPLAYRYICKAVMSTESTVRETCWYFIDTITRNNGVASFQLTRPSPDAEALEMTIHADDYYQALKTQILLHIYKGKQGRDGVDIAICRDCGKPYARVRKNSRLCSLCGSSAERSRSCRQRKRLEVKQDGKKKDNP